MAERFFLGLNADGWTAIGAIGTFLLVGVGLWTVLAGRFENKKARTLAACNQYDLNPNMYEALKLLWTARESGDLEKNPRLYRPQINLVLNILDAIAIGIAQGLYIESLAFDHLNGIVQAHVTRLINSNIAERADIPSASYVHLMDLQARWQRAKPRFRDGLNWRFWTR